MSERTGRYRQRALIRDRLSEMECLCSDDGANIRNLAAEVVELWEHLWALEDEIVDDVPQRITRGVFGWRK